MNKNKIKFWDLINENSANMCHTISLIEQINEMN